MFSPALICLSVSLCARLLKKYAWIWMKCCMLTDVGTWMNLLTFEPDLDHSPDAGTGFLLPILYIGYGTLQPCLVWRISRPFPYQFALNSHTVF